MSGDDFAGVLQLVTVVGAGAAGGWGMWNLSTVLIQSQNEKQINRAQEKIKTLDTEQKVSGEQEATVLSNDSYETNTHLGDVKLYTHVPYSELKQVQTTIIQEHSKPPTHGAGSYVLTGVGIVIGAVIAVGVVGDKLLHLYDNAGDMLHTFVHKKNKFPSLKIGGSGGGGH